MKMRVLGCAGGIGGRERLTTCLAVDDDVLLDAGTGIASLSLEELTRIDHVFLTHSHLDHVTGLALLADAVMGRRSGAITVHATQPVIDALKKHLFNWILWPDFSAIPDAQAPILRWQPMTYGQTVALGGRLFTPHQVNHMGGSAAWWVRGDDGGFLFTGDMASTPQLWQDMAGEAQLRQVVVDCSFANAERALAETSLHFCPEALLADIAPLPLSVEFLIYHLKPGHEDAIMEELGADGARQFRAVRCGDVFEY